MKLLFPLLTLSLSAVSYAQISAMFGNPIQAANCETWSEWGPCVWLKGKEKRLYRLAEPCLSPESDRKKCRSEEKRGHNGSEDVTLSDTQCGECSYQQSCGRQCHRKGDVSIINPLFVAERKCMGVDQNKACVSRYMNDCKLWPNKAVQLPNVTESMQQIVDGLDYLTCVPEHRPEGSVCRCCCHPYTPNPTTFECELKPYLG